MNYIIKKDNKTKNIISIEINDCYSFKPHIKKYPKLENITIYDDNMIEYLIVNKLSKKYQRLLDIISSFNGEEDNSDFMICLDEITKLYEMVEYKYKKFLKREMYNNFLDNINNLRQFVFISQERSDSVRR